ncbi:MAG: TRAM domain-containing protein, partial [Flavobacteriales bacterium]
MAKKALPVFENITVTGWGAKGKAIAKLDGLVIFITGAVPGDVVDLRVTRKKKSYAEATATRLITPSPDRVVPFCTHFGICGGCGWQDYSYSAQLVNKRQEVLDDLQRIGGLELPEVPPTIASPKTQFYRNKLEYTFTAQRWFTKAELDKGEVITDRKAL